MQLSKLAVIFLLACSTLSANKCYRPTKKEQANHTLLLEHLKKLEKGITELDLSGMFSPRNVKDVADLALITDIISDLHTIDTVNLSNNSLGDDADLFILICRNLCDIGKLSACNNALQAIDPKKLAEAFSQFSPALLALDLTGNYLGWLMPEGFETFVRGLPHGLRFLDLRRNDLHYVQAKNLATTINVYAPKTLKVVGLTENGFSSPEKTYLEKELPNIKFVWDYTALF